MRKVLYALLLGLVGAGIVHIVVLLLVPQFSERDAWSRLAMKSGLYTMTRIDDQTGGPPVVKSVDPLFFAASCRFDLADGIVRLRSPIDNLPFWSMSVYDRNGHNLYSYNDLSATEGRLNAIVLTPAQMIGVRKTLPEGLEGSVFIELPISEGITVVRGFVPDASWKQAVARFLDQASCEIVDFAS
ncbi:DUF1254 domain-containing protein [Manganibacter manganicus]|uniref:DUF1254 domain-containing protein n=1 Tax=Manganibacter manganicus TaxID=1873176 RepID=A0A1V8RPV3_9HYPH|nr:DUF1254 domain-containing protein [Pseudaminobacter manganicus]OQM75205.1 DUF1254 domain-containing protein [Pseudaminobacter manganicus]